MNKHLNNWLDKQDGLPANTSNNNIKKELKRYVDQDGNDVWTTPSSVAKRIKAVKAAQDFTNSFLKANVDALNRAKLD